MPVQEVKMRVGKYMKPVSRWEDEQGRLHFKWKGFYRSLSEELKAMEGSKFDWEDKHWSIAQTQRNEFQLEWLYGGDPYKRYDNRWSRSSRGGKRTTSTRSTSPGTF
jgi:hypothetical protein